MLISYVCLFSYAYEISLQVRVRELPSPLPKGQCHMTLVKSLFLKGCKRFLEWGSWHVVTISDSGMNYEPTFTDLHCSQKETQPPIFCFPKYLSLIIDTNLNLLSSHSVIVLSLLDIQLYYFATFQNNPL